METKVPCGGGCGGSVTGIHSCPSCHAYMHPFCGRPIGEEGYGQPVLCPRCDSAQTLDEPPSASPILAAFDRARKQQPRPLHSEARSSIPSAELDDESNSEKSDKSASMTASNTNSTSNMRKRRPNTVKDEWQNAKRKDGSWSGKLRNPGKSFFLRLAAETVFELNSKRDENGLNYARKSMIRCGLSLDIDGSWKTSQLFPHLQEIIRKFPEHFAGKPVDESEEVVYVGTTESVCEDKDTRRVNDEGKSRKRCVKQWYSD